MLQEYIQKLSNLNTDRGKHRWSSVTCHRAPHKPFLLLSVMDLIAQGVVTENFIESSFDLVDHFNIYWSLVMPVGSKTSMAYPFPRLKTDGFWHLVPNPGYEQQIDMDFSSITKLREVCAGARMDEELFLSICNPVTRDQLRTVLLDTYFAPEIRPLLVEQGSINVAAYEYSRELLKEVRETERIWGEDEASGKNEKVRDQGFRKAIVSLYEHRCALCGIRMLTPEGHTVVEAAHIKPWSESHDDQPTNGMALCRLCHWYFDEGLMSVGKEYEVLVSKGIQVEQNLPGHIQTLRDRNIFTPDDNKYWPAQDNLHYHRKERFRA